MNPDNRGSRSYEPMTRAINRRGKPCSRLKSHFVFDSSYRTAISYLEYLASNDSDRFVWPEKWKQFQGSNGKKKRQLFYCLSFFEGLGLIIPAYLFRRGAWRHGYIVADHDKISRISADKELCTLRTKDPSSFVPRRRGQKRMHGCNSNAAAVTEAGHAKLAIKPLSAFEDSLSASENSASAFESAFESALGTGSECISSKPKPLVEMKLQDDSEDRAQAIPVNPVNPVKENPVKETPVDNDHHNPPAVSFPTQTVDFSKTDGQGKTLTYGDMLLEELNYRYQSEDYAGTISTATRGRIQLERLKRYEHGPELAWACVDIVESLSAEPWPPQPDAAFTRIMSGVMNRMNGDELKVPRSWVACLNELRRQLKIAAPEYPEMLTNLLNEMNWIANGQTIFSRKCQQTVFDVLRLRTSDQVLDLWREYWTEQIKPTDSGSWKFSASARFCKHVLSEVVLSQSQRDLANVVQSS